MDTHRFDSLARQLFVLKNRREGVRVILAGLAAIAFGLPSPAEAADCQGKGSACEKNEDCCSRICRFSGFRHRKGGQAEQAGRTVQQEIAVQRRRKKGRKGQKCKKGGKGRIGTERRDTCKGGKKGTCDCSRLKDRCSKASDCCFDDQGCETNGCEEHTVCCKKQGDLCEDDCDCCGERSFCDEDAGRCEDCGEKKLTQEGPCANDEDCCFDEDTCASIAPTCEGRQGDKQCCVKPGEACEEHCDCCHPFFCDEDLGQCVGPGSFCPPDGVVCTSPNRIKDCCDEGFAECCDQGSAAGCCQTGFPVCCAEPHAETGAGCCPEGFQCCPPTSVVPCCPEDQFCCASGETFCADNLGDCDPI